MRGQRVLVSGMGGELGSLVASMLEDQPWVGPILGIDIDPPRRRLHRSEFHRIDPRDRHRIVELVTRFDPHVLVHLAVWEPDARAGTTLAKRLTCESATSIISAAAECPSLQAIVVRSGTEIYGRGRGALTRPDEDSPTHPTSEYGRMVAAIEATAQTVGDRVGVAVSALRLAPVLGPHVPSPLGRALRQPVVPFSVLADSAFAVTIDSDAARAFVAAAEQRPQGPLNVVGPGAITTMQAIWRGRRLPLPLFGPEWRIARHVSHLLGAPLPEHVMELIHRGRLADGRRLAATLGITPQVSTREVIDRLFQWEAIVRVPASQAA
ncbi:MAG: UDP-glucose 4-epimerase [Ilumatobacteraceae bacterium]|jgi:UDP-glucose 4-epimerase|nr:UDP-glucose 4-epimerase [Ilumatobacteraceae bacterium]